MKNFLSKLWSLSQTDRVRTLAIDAVSLPSFCRMNMLKLVSILVILLTLGVGTMRADISTQVAGGLNLNVMQNDTVRETETMRSELSSSISSIDFYLGIGTSCLAAILLLILYYIILRPRLTVMPYVALLKSKNKQTKNNHAK